MAAIAMVEMETGMAVEMEMLATGTEVAAAVVEMEILVTGMEVEAAMVEMENLATWVEVVTLATGIVVEAGLVGMDNQSIMTVMELAEVNKINNVAKVNIHSVPVINVG